MIFRVIVAVFMAGMLFMPADLFAQTSVEDDAVDVSIHVVQRGESLYAIALQYGLTIEQLAALNGLTDIHSLQIGQRLLVSTTLEMPEEATHVVQAGESLQSIAGLYGIESLTLASLNNVSPENPLFVGQSLVLPASVEPVVVDAPVTPDADAPVFTPTSSPAPAPRLLVHTVLDGETLFRIATLYGVTVPEISAANGIADPTMIFIGQQLIIPGVEIPPLALDLPAPVVNIVVDPVIWVEGQTGRLQLDTSVGATVTGEFLGNSLPSARQSDGLSHIMFVGIPMFTEPDVYPLNLSVVVDATGETVALSANIQVIGGAYSSEYINLLEDRTNLLNENVDGAETELLKNIMRNFTPEPAFQGKMGLPAAAAMTSAFGTRRSYDGGEFNRYHSGADFAGAPGTPVLASAPGVVVMADLLHVRGNAILIDHGWGIYTLYAHQQELYVRPGDVVKMGQVIGTIGATGRVTGVHLHWEVWVNGVLVDPMQWVRQAFM